MNIFGIFGGITFAYSNKAYLLFPLSILSTVINVVMNILLIPRFGIIGGALSALTAYILVDFTMIIIGHKLYKIGYEVTNLSMMYSVVLASAVLMLLCEFTQYFGLYYFVIKLFFFALYLFVGIISEIVTKEHILRVFNILLKKKAAL